MCSYVFPCMDGCEDIKKRRVKKKDILCQLLLGVSVHELLLLTCHLTVLLCFLF